MKGREAVSIFITQSEKNSLTLQDHESYLHLEQENHVFKRATVQH